MQVLHVITPVHGRFLHVDRGPERLLVGFHGYAETAERHLEEIEKIPGIAGWSVAAVQALHPFYTRSGAVVANWMTSQDRDLAIEDNHLYVQQVLRSVPPRRTLVFLGFSQGAAMAARAAAATPAQGLVMIGGDLPPEVQPTSLPPALLARGERDDWYTDEKLKNDLRCLPGATACVYAGGHEWTDELRDAVGDFLRKVSSGG